MIESKQTYAKYRKESLEDKEQQPENNVEIDRLEKKLARECGVLLFPPHGRQSPIARYSNDIRGKGRVEEMEQEDEDEITSLPPLQSPFLTTRITTSALATLAPTINSSILPTGAEPGWRPPPAPITRTNTAAIEEGINGSPQSFMPYVPPQRPAAPISGTSRIEPPGISLDMKQRNVQGVLDALAGKSSRGPDTEERGRAQLEEFQSATQSALDEDAAEDVPINPAPEPGIRRQDSLPIPVTSLGTAAELALRPNNNPYRNGSYLRNLPYKQGAES
jgi:hypothetical protein